MSAERLALGTVQFGLDYGVANRSGQVSPGEAADILRLAQAAGIDTLDTAAGYGESESRLGEVGVTGWRIVTKLPEVPSSVDDIAAWMAAEVESSMRRLGVAHLHAVLLHRPLQLTGPRGDEVWAALGAVLQSGVADRVGISVYGPDQLDAVWDAGLGIVQAPYNAFDRRLVTSGWLQRLADADVEVHTRSSFLQGLLLMEDRPRYFDRWREVFERWDAWIDESGVTPLQGALGVAVADDRIDRVVVGVDSPAQLTEIVDAVASGLPTPPDILATGDEDLIDPSRWEVP